MTTMYIHMLYTYAQTLFTSAPPHRMMMSSICLAVCEFLWAFGYTPEGFVTFLSTTSSPYFELISVCYLIGTCYWFLFSFSISLLLFFFWLYINNCIAECWMECRVLVRHVRLKYCQFQVSTNLSVGERYDMIWCDTPQPNFSYTPLLSL